MYDVQVALKSQGFSSSQEDLSKWFAKGGVKAMSPKAIGTMAQDLVSVFPGRPGCREAH